jgi:hypothetical protein
VNGKCRVGPRAGWVLPLHADGVVSGFKRQSSD